MIKHLRYLLAGAVLLSTAFLISEVDAASTQVRVTHYYATGNVTYSGVYPYHGSAACSWNFPLGTVLRFWDGRTVVCEDRGLLGSSGWVDIYAATWAEGQRIQQAYEYYSGRESVEIVRWGF